MITGKRIISDHVSSALPKAPKVDSLVLGKNKENKNNHNHNHNGADASQTNILIKVRPTAKGQSLFGAKYGASPVSASRRPKNPGENEAGKQRNSRAQTNEVQRIASAMPLRKQSPRLSESAHFVAKGNGSPMNGLRKSANYVKVTKTDAKNPNTIRSQVAISISNGATYSKQTKLAIMSGTHQSAEATSGSPHTTVALASSKPQTYSQAVLQQKNNSSGFAFGSNRITEKPKIVVKLKQNTHTKNVDKSNFQEKSKDTKGNEIKQLTMIIKLNAPSVSSLCKESSAPKIKSMKPPSVPRTGNQRPPQLARDAMSSRNLPPQVTPTRSNEDAANKFTSSTAVQRSLPKVPLKKATNSKLEAKAQARKAKISIPNNKVARAKVEARNNLESKSLGGVKGKVSSPRNKITTANVASQENPKKQADEPSLFTDDDRLNLVSMNNSDEDEKIILDLPDP